MFRKFEVYADDDNWFFSDAVRREFGENRVIRLVDGKTAFSVVSKANEFSRQLPVVGYIETQCCGMCQDACSSEPDEIGFVACDDCVRFAVESILGK